MGVLEEEHRSQGMAGLDLTVWEAQDNSMAEREGFEPPVPLRVRLISSQVHSTGLCHLSAFGLTADPF